MLPTELPPRSMMSIRPAPPSGDPISPVMRTGARPGGVGASTVAGAVASISSVSESPSCRQPSTSASGAGAGAGAAGFC